MTIEEFTIEYDCGCKIGLRSDNVKIDARCFKHSEFLVNAHKILFPNDP